MFQSIASKIRFPEWIKRDTRYLNYELRDRLLDGTFYDHLMYGFYDELDAQQRLIPLADRRPSAQFRLMRMVARWCSRKLFAGRHKPRIRHPDKKASKTIERLAVQCGLWQRMSEAVVRGSIGACAATFRVEAAAEDGAPAQVEIKIWHAKYCSPTFDAVGQLTSLRVQMLVTFDFFARQGLVDPNFKPADKVWFVRDYGIDDEITYRPIGEVKYNPLDGFIEPSDRFVIWEEHKHGFGFVPAHWFVNLPSADSIEAGGCTFEDAIPNSIELDYTLSQTGRGVRYNCAPQLVVVGDIMNDQKEIIRGPMTHLQLKAGFKEEDGQTVGAGDAKLLEMTGAGTTASLAMIETLRNLALEQIAASRKDPEKMKAPMSGRAMEYLDEDSNDLVMDLRSQYGEYGALPLIKKIAQATGVIENPAALALQWPRMFQPTPDELNQIVVALMAATGLAAAQKPAPTPAPKPAAAGAPAAPAPKPQQPKPFDEETMTLLSVAEAKAYLRMIMDIDMLDLDTDEDDEESIATDTTQPSSKPQRPDPEPLAPEDHSNAGAGEYAERSAAEFAAEAELMTTGGA